jgi:predicted transposase/invertase (TIGR01784 family)
MAYDNLCKYLAETYPAAFVRWLARHYPELPHDMEAAEVEVLKTELPVEPIRADFVTFIRAAGVLLHIEFHLDPASDPPLAFRMLEYWVRLFRRYRTPARQVVLLLKSTPAAREMPSTFTAGMTHHGFHVLRLWEVEATELLDDEALLPLAVLGKADSDEALLRETAARVEQMTDASQRANVSACAQVLAGLRFDRELIRALFREEAMRESVIYQEIIERGLAQGVERGLAQGSHLEAIRLARTLLERRFGPLPESITAQIALLSREQAENLAVETLNFDSLDAVRTWLALRPTTSEVTENPDKPS